MFRQSGRVALRLLLPLSLAGLALLTQFEGFRSLPYKDIVGIWTDGYGNTQGVRPGVPVTKEQAEQKLMEHVDRMQAAIDSCLYRGATQAQSDAYTILAYNIGETAFCNSSIATLHNDGRFREACNAFALYDKVRINGRLVRSAGLASRRARERELCLQGIDI